MVNNELVCTTERSTDGEEGYTGQQTCAGSGVCMQLLCQRAFFLAGEPPRGRCDAPCAFDARSRL